MMNLRATGQGSLSVGEREFTNIDYFITTIGVIEPVVIGVITLAPEDSKELLSLFGERALLNLCDGRKLNVCLDSFEYLYTSSTPPDDFVVLVDSQVVS